MREVIFATKGMTKESAAENAAYHAADTATGEMFLPKLKSVSK
jgi:hypothetical protein